MTFPNAGARLHHVVRGAAETDNRPIDNQPSIAIRDYTETDAPEVIALLAELGYPSSVRQVTERFQRLAREEARIFVAEIDNHVAGLAAMQVGSLVEDDDLYCGLIALVVGSRWQRQGVGRTLVRAVETEAARRNCGTIVLNSGDHRHDAHAFYEQLGYASTGRRFIKRL